ncbi:MAG: EAL domain-containing protein [Gammaproteobacteria bacterium]|nr:EAL domain-containing protein [Gammaproteobacteria bacterium]
MADDDKDMLVFLADEPDPAAEQEATAAAVWRVLLVDDEPDVHTATKVALRNLDIEGRRLEFQHAYSDAEARKVLQQEAPFAVAVIDVVMESDTAGLDLVRYIREELADAQVRLILRTGQPGYAPEISTIQNYDINDYRTKSELTQSRLFTSLTMAVRSYSQLCQLEAGRVGLEQILDATRELSRPSGLQQFATGLLTQLCALLRIDCDGLLCAALHPATRQPYILAAAGQYSNWTGKLLEELPEGGIRSRLEQSLQAREHVLNGDIGLFFEGANGQALAAYVNIGRQLSELEQQLLEVFCNNMSTAFENLQLYLDIEALAFRDTLVDLPNRNALLQLLDQHSGEQHTLALVDLDNFADINNILDESFGDAVLQAVARQLCSAFSEQCMVSRLASNLFGVYGPDVEVNPDQIQSLFAQPFQVGDGQTLRLSATTGLARAEGRCGKDLLKNAGAALKQAKRLVRGKHLYFKLEQSRAARDRINMLQMLRTALSEQHLQLYYQPFICLRNRQVTGAECLLRWRTPDGQFISPEDFIPIAEQSGLMVAIGEWVLRTALRWRISLQDRVADDFRVAVNISQVQFAEPSFVERLLSILRETGVPRHQLELELTESVAIEDFDRLKSKLQQIQAAGIDIAMDDFGTGYSSLSVLQRLDLNRLKIDRSFISGEKNHDSFDMAKTIIAMAEHLELQTIAEGIETEEQCAELLASGCEEGQGYLFARPMPEADFIVWLDAWPGA